MLATSPFTPEWVAARRAATAAADARRVRAERAHPEGLRLWEQANEVLATAWHHAGHDIAQTVALHPESAAALRRFFDDAWGTRDDGLLESEFGCLSVSEDGAVPPGVVRYAP